MAPTVPQAAPGGRRADLSVPKTAVPERGLAVSRDPVRRADSLALEPVLSTHRVFEAMDPKRAGLEILHADLFDARPQVVLSALAAVGALGDERSFTVVARVFAAAGEDLRCAAARTLGKLRGSAAPRLLLDAVRTARSEKLRRAILEALAEGAAPGTEAFAVIRHVALSAMAGAGTRAHAAGLLLRAGGEAALAELLPGAREETLDAVLARAAEDERVAPGVVAHCAPLYATLPVRARSALAALAAAHALPASPGLLRAALADPHPEVRRAAYAATGTKPHHAAWSSALVGQLAESTEPSPALEDEVQQALSRLDKLPGARAGVAPAVQARVMELVTDLFRQLTATGRKVSSDEHELGWLITRSKEYVEYYGDEDLKGALLRWLKGASSDTTDGMLRMLKATAVRVEVRHFDGYSAVAELIKNPRRNGIALVARELALAKTGKAHVLWRLIRCLRLAALFLVPRAAEAGLVRGIYTWARQERLFRLAEAALGAFARVDAAGAEAACGESLGLPLASKVLAIASLHLLRGLRPDTLESRAAALIASMDDPYVIMNAVEAISGGVPSAHPGLARALVSRLSSSGREVKESVAAFLGEGVSLDITESIRDAAFSKDPATRETALSILDKRIAVGHAINRPAVSELLYRILRGDDEAARRTAALVLLKMGDSYAVEVLRDLLAAGPDAAAVPMIGGLRGYVKGPVAELVAALLPRDSAAVQAAVRDLLAGITDETARSVLLEKALALRGGTGSEEDGPEEPVVDAPAPVLDTERSAFQFERENMQKLVMFFSDIKGYSKKAETLTPLQLSTLIQEYEKILLTHVEGHHGQLLKRMGDGHMILFESPLNAVLAAIRLQKALRRFNRYRDEISRVVVRVGIHSGNVVRKGRGDVLGNPVNIASRLETAAQPGSILISEEVHAAVRDSIHAREIGRITVKNIAEPIRVFEPYEIVIDLAPALDPLKAAPPAGSPPPVAAPEAWNEVARCFAALDALCREADAVLVSSIKEQVLKPWERLRPRVAA